MQRPKRAAKGGAKRSKKTTKIKKAAKKQAPKRIKKTAGKGPKKTAKSSPPSTRRPKRTTARQPKAAPKRAVKKPKPTLARQPAVETARMPKPAASAAGARPQGLRNAPNAGAAAKVAPLKLASWAQEAALILAEAFPEIRFTSGRRDMARQARAMAGNVILKRDYIENTYADTAESRALQKWVDDHPAANTVDEITEGLKSVMANWTDGQLAKISRHIAGLAFDVQPFEGGSAEAVKQRMTALPHLQKPPIFVEDGLPRWHAQFKSTDEDPGRR